MTSFQECVVGQVASGQEIQRIITNFKKDSSDRKNSRTYFEERLLRLQEQWKKFEQGDQKINRLSNVDEDHEYFTKNYFKEIAALVQQYSKCFEEGILSFDKQAKMDQVDLPKPSPRSIEVLEPSKITSAIRRQRAIMCSLERLLDGLSISNNEPSQYHEIKFRSIEQLWQQVESVNYTIWELSDDPIVEGYDQTDFINMEQRVQEVLVTLSMRIQSQDSSSHEVGIIKNNSLHLPKVTIPKFDGDYMKWRQFFDLFSQMVDKQSIPNIQKMWYLKTHLSGEAENLIRHLSLTEDNYKTAWTSLQDRYNNIRVLTSTLLQKIIGQPNNSQPQPSAAAIKNLHDTTQECLMALCNIGVDTASWDPILLHLLVSKLDQGTRILYEQSLTKPKELQSMKEFLSFLENQFQSLESVGQKKKDPTPRACASVTSNRKGTCIVCKSGTHPIFACKQFLQLQTSERIPLVQKQKICFNCLKSGHGVKNCISRGCLKCNLKHNTLLHLENHNKGSLSNKHTTFIEGDNNPKSQTNISSSVTLSASKDPDRHHYIFLSTAVVELITNNGQRFECRAVLDSGSQVNLITERIVRKLGLHSKQTSMSIQGIGIGKRESHHRVNVKMQSRTSDFNTQLEAFVLPHIISPQPSQHFNISSWAIPKNVPLADPFFNRPDKIDILLGAEFYHQLLSIGQIRLADDLPTLQNTVLGWVIAGKLTEAKSNTATCGISTYDDNELHQMIERLWRLEEVETQCSNLSRDEEMCEAHFAQNTQISSDGRFMVKLPFHENTNALGKSKDIAVNRFLALERRLAKNREVRDQYIQFMEEYEDLGHMTKIDVNNIQAPNYFIPHHCVFKEDSCTTRLRVVFDASSKTSSGLSLNDIMYTGPTVQGELFSLLLRFRLSRYVFCADIQKMYRQITMHPEDRRYQTIVWRSDEKGPLNYYQLNTVTYGTRAAPYLATKCLQKLAKDNSERFPLGSKALHNDFYVDDCLTGDNSLITTLEMQDQVTQLLKDAGFKLRKWCANHPRLLQGIAKEDQEIDLDFGNETNAAIKALGLTWQPKNDRFCVKTKLNTTNRITKRIVTSDLAKLFDPLGIMAPIFVTAKIFVQELWLLKLSWDESLPAELHTRWMQFREDLKCLNNFQFSRHMFNNDVPAEIQIHTFCDASEKAYGTVVYLRAILKNGTIIVRLLCSKSRVAPLKRQTLPRLELCAAVLGAQLTARVKNDLNLKDVPSFLWTDSEIVLAWINAPSASFQTFVANRVSSIQRLTPPEQWRHVSSKHNPADVISRGLQPKIFTSCTLWFYGPLFLHGKEDMWPAKYSKNLAVTEGTERKRKIPTVAAATYNCDQNMIYKINHGNSFSTLQRITAYILRFCKHARNKKVIRQDEIQLTTRELEDALIVIIQAMQAFDFKDEISDLQKYKEPKRNSHFSSLAPFLDDKGIVRVGGRLDSGLLPFDTKHPMLLPYNNPLAKLLMQEVHEKHKHCGPQTLLAQMRQRFWPIKGKIMARSIVHHCVKCTRARPQLIQQVMGSLPAPRITPARPFINSGVDYCGPFWIHYKIRGKRPQKAYVAIFCCFVTKAVHIELVSDLTTESFLGALKRFIGRRGHCQNIYCDNATNFVGANNQLSELYDTIYSEGARETITKECSGHAIQFNFIPPRAPHFGGLWEAAVKSAKHLLKRSVSTASLTYEELETVLVGIEAILNSRPLTPLSSDPNDLTALTPGHFLIGEPLTAKTDVNAIPMKQTLLSRWNLVSHLKNEFWKRWSQEYLHELQYRYKWKECSSNIKVGDMVIIKEDNVPSLQWPLGRIVKTFKGNDGAIRVVEVRTASGVWKRPIHRLAPLPVEEEVDDITLRSADDDSNTKSSEHEIPTKRRKTSTAMGITSLLTILLLIPLVMSEEIQINKFKSNLGIHFEEIGTAKIATSEWNFIIHYNLDPLLEEYTAFENGTLTLNHLCQQMQQRSICINTLNQFQHIQNELKSENTILPIRRNKRAAANFIGNIANALFGVLDSEYADQMTRTIDQVKENENHLLHLLRNQTSVIDSTINIVSQNEEIINHRLDQINNQLREITSRIRDNGEESHQLKIFQIFTSLSSQLIMMMINIQRMQATLIDVLTDTHHGKVSSLVMSSRQLKDEVKTIKAHLPSFLELPADEEDLIQLYKLMTVKGGVTDRRAVFWITLPLVDQEFYELFKMTSIPSVINNTIFTINLCAPILAVNAHRDQYLPLQSSDMESCINLRSEQFLCYNLQARYSKGSEVCSCEFGLFNNDTRPTCSLKKSDTNSTWIQMQHKNQWLYFTRYPSRLTAICGRRNLQMDLEGSGILSLQAGCILKQNHITIEGHNAYSTKLQTSFISFGNISEISTPMHYESLLQTFNSTHYNIQLKNLTDLHKIIAEQEILELPHKLQLHTYHNSAIGYLALLLTIIIISYLIWKRKSGRSSVISKKPNPSPRHTQPESEFIVTVT